ncbi:HEPN domain-containing protein [Mariniphaga sp.]|uniref:HEPN domain-containing protein n=1 Tax=Mariniphaga sp. TaxID=1954475 RepID=UPI0035620CA2
MTLDKEDRKNLISYRFEQAEETIQDVKLLIENERLRSAVNRIYYGMFYSLLALGLAYEFETSKHAQLIGWFNKKFIHSGLIDSKYGKIINKAFNRRTKGDYDTYVVFEKEIIRDMFDEMKEFITSIKIYIEKNKNNYL